MSIRIRKLYLLLAVIILTLTSIFLIVLSQLHFFSRPRTTSAEDFTVTSELRLSPTDTVGNNKAYNAIKQVSDTQGVEATWRSVLDNYGKEPTLQESAHDYAHYVGLLIYEKKGLPGMSICTTDFAFGCYHGLLDQAFRNDLSRLSQAEQACKQVGVINSGPYNSCIHGIGHGIASYFKDKDLTGALKTCDKLPESSPQYCYDGVFMEFSRDALDSFYRPTDPLYPCDSLEGKYVFSCGRNQPSVMTSRLHLSYDDIYNACHKAANVDLRTSCYVALGFQAVYASNEDPQKIIAMCDNYKDREFEYQCKSAAAGELVFQNFTNWQTNAPMVCNTISGKDQQKRCNEHTLVIQKSYGR
ncbi:hypothetical protein BH09PAT1_BH09PAT1_5160 [soil metagenome]